MSPRLRHLLITTSALLVLGSLPGAAGPDGANVVGGSASVQGQSTGSVIVNQSSDRAIINWNTFNIGIGESARFNQPGVSSVILNRVIGGLGPSTIDGTLTANGRVFVVNGDGLVIGSHAVINTAGFLATTSDIKNKDFMAGRYNFNRPGQPDASIVNQGHITATSGGFAALVAPGVRNSGTISATLGTVALASGNMFTLDLYGDRLIQIGVGDKIASQVLDVATGRPLSSLVTNDGKLRANGGRVELTAAAARRVVDSVINTTGVVEANSVGRRNGMIVIGAATAGSRGADLPRQTVRIAGRISAAGKRKDTTGGTVVVTGEDIQIANAQINASGRAGGGRVLIGGDWGGGKPNKSLVANPSAKLESFVIPTATTVSIDAATTINASATGHGNGGKVVLWSGSETTFAGTILARGGARSGDGGFVEVSSPQLLNYSGTTDTRAPKGAVGTLLLDPENFYVNANGLPPNSDPTASAISADTLVNQLASNNVVLSTLPSGTHAGDIFVDAHVSWSTGNSLTLSAFHDILFMSGTQVTNTGAGNLVLRADNTGTGQGIVVFNPGGHVDYMQSTGTVSIFYNPSGFQTTKYQNPTNYFCPPCPGGGGVFGQQPSQLTAYMLVNNASDLQAVSTNLGGTYALGRNIDASTFTASIPGTFTGLFDGNGGLGVNYAVDHLPVGLFSTIGSGGAVRNLSLTNVSLTANADGTFGPLASINNGTITNVSAAGAVSDASSFVVIAGGLVGQNSGSIARSFANVSVTASNSQFSILGGLVGLNSGDIARSSAIGTIASGNSAAVGGLVGANSGGSISESFAGGNVSAGNSSFVGGLVGINGNNDTGGSISASYATGAVTAGTGSSIGGLVGTQVSDGTVENSFATGRVSGGSLAGGLIGFNDGGSITGSYWDRQTTGQLTSSGSPDSAGLTTVQLQAALPSGWDSSVWGIVPGVSYPYLNWQFPVGTPQVVSGVAFNDHGITPVAGGTVVGGVLSGSLLRSVLTGGPVTTGANGYYYYLLPPGTISPPATQLGVGTFQAGPLAGGTYLQNAAGSTIHLDIYGTYLRGITGEGTLSAFNTGLATAIGSNPGIAAVVNALPNRQIEAKGASFAIDEALHATGSATVTAAGPLTIAAGANVTGTDVVLATPGAFVNNAGSAAVTASNRWLIYSNNPDADTFGNLDSGNTAIWNATPNSLPPANVTAAGNRYIFAFQPTLTFTSTDVHKTYGDDASAAVASAFTVAGFQPGVAHAFLGDTAATAFSGAPSLTSAGAVATASVAGSPYPITISAGSLTSPSGYAFAFGSAGVLTVNPATLTYTADVVSRLYGSPNPAFNGTVTGFVNGESLASATTGVLSFTSPATTTSNVGNYAINGSGLIANNSNYVFVQAAGNTTALSVNPTTLTYVADPTSRLYGAANPAFGGTVLGFVNGENLATATTGTLAFSSTATTASNVGNYPITGSGLVANNGNYVFNQATGNATALTINPSTLTYNANAANRLYGADNPVFGGTVAGFVNGETLATATTGAASFTSPANASSNVGNYAINGSGLVANHGNYVFTQAAGNATALTINPATLTYTANAANRLYGADNPVFGGTVAGFVNGETLATATTGAASFTSPANASSNVGNYAINGSGLTANHGNYVFTQAAANATALTINPATLTYVANAANRVYGDANPVFGGTVAGFVNGESIATATTGTLSFASTATAGSNVGNYAINGSGLVANHGNYVFTQAAGNATALAVTPRPLTITADDASKTEGQTLTFAGTEFHANGLVNGDAVAAVTLTSPGAAAAALAANSPFAIRATDPLGSGLGNYAISFVDGTLTVNANPQQTTTTQIVQQLVNQAQQATTTQIVQQLVNQAQPPTTPPQLFNLIALNPPATSGGSGQSSPPQQQPPGPTGSRVIDIPPPTESRFVKDEVVFQIAGNVTVERLQAAVGRLGLTLLASENLAITGSTVARFRITDGRSPAEIIPALAAIQLVGVAQPNYVYTLQQQPSNPVPASRGDATQGDPAQYMLEKLKISEIHRMVRGANVPIAVIDSEIDVTHPDLEGAVTKRFDAVGAPENSHAHGTGMAGAIAAHRRLLGTAPAARLLAVHAFPSTAATAESTTFNILKGINWSVQEGARIINMSFAGPRDPSLARALKAAYDKGIVLIAAAGNAGPKSPPLFPGADPYVIAVTATDVDDKLFTGANRGKHISVAAPGVDILVPAPEGNYQITTGTSVAAAEVSGIVALLLERNPKLTPADIRRILIASAKRLAPGERDDNFGSGLIDPLQALQLADPRIATTTPPRRR